MNMALNGTFLKPLPSLNGDEELPPPPEDEDAIASSSKPPQLDFLPSFGSLDPAISLSLSPTAPTSSSSPSASAPPSPSLDGKPRKSNPLIDLIETERTYVDQLTGIIRKVAAAWSRSNLPPPELDTMFRSVEAVYKANRSLLSKLKEIGPNPSSPKALGDLLMRWIDDLEAPYSTYCTKFCTGFDIWEPVQSNPKLSTVLAAYSDAQQPPPETPTWTLDALFLLPKTRLKYYRKLYGRLLKSTAPGRSDHKLLLRAIDTLDRLLSTAEGRADVQVGGPPLAPPAIETEDEVVINMNGGDDAKKPSPTVSSENPTTPGSASSSARGSLLSSGERLSRETATTSFSRASTQTLSMPVSDLERRLATDRTLDIFTMTPKVVRLQMSPPSLPFKRELRFSADVTISFTPRATGIEVVHHEGHVFLLTDLFLICERMAPEERQPDGPDMWLCYPPLAGKVLRISEVPDQENVLQVSIMRKEVLTLHLESAKQRDAMISEFSECIEFSSSGMANPMPPVPPLNGIPRGGPAGYPNSPGSGFSPQGAFSQERNGLPGASPPPVSVPPGGNMSPMTHRASVDFATALDHRRSYERSLPPAPNQQLAEGMSNMSLGPDGQYGMNALHESTFPPRASQMSGYPIGPGHAMPPRNGSMGPPPGAGFNPPMGPATQPPRLLYQQPPYHNMNNPPAYPRQPGLPFNNASPPGPPEMQFQDSLSRVTSSRSLESYDQHNQMHPSMLSPPPLPNNYAMRSASFETLHAPQPRPLLPSARFRPRSNSMTDQPFGNEPSPPGSPIDDRMPTGPVTNTIVAQMKCKLFLQQQHAQWKNLGTAKLKLYLQQPTYVKQLVVEADNKDKTILISTIVLTDGVERVGKTGVAIELSDKGARTGIIYMIQLRNETSAGGLFDSLLAGSDRSAKA